MEKDARRMAASGTAGFLFFLAANVFHLFAGSSIIAGCLQLVVNAFVFITWGNAFRTSRGMKKGIAFIGTVVPFVMASITLCRGLVPAVWRVIAG
jgi:hypothetical protein